MLLSRCLDNKGTYKSEYLGEEITNLLDKTFELPYRFACNIIEVEEDYIARPDLLAKEIYGDDIYTDLICKINGISNPFELNEGMYLLVPAIDELDSFIVKPNRVWSGDKKRNPTPKKKQDKRKPNEAVMGDQRFRIDPLSKIVIY